MYDEKLKNHVRFDFVSYDDDGDITSSVTRTLYGDDCEYLTKLLQEFTYFLQGMTYSYVAGVAALNADGSIGHSSDL